MRSKCYIVVFCAAVLCCLQAHSSVEYPPEQWLSGTLPVLYVNTDSCKPITSKSEYIAGSYYLDPCGIDGVEAVGSAESPLPLEIRGRGNASWFNASYRKKPYKLKLEKKAALMGMSKSNHWVLMAHWEDGSVFLKDESGFEFSRRIGMEWTPRQRAVELVLNGEYMGLYFIAENVRVESTKVDVVEQNEGETNPMAVTGGWLLETDNYEGDNQLHFKAGNGELLRIAYKSPETVSPEQKSYLKKLITKADSAIYVTDKWSRIWEDIIDLDALARYYIVSEIVDDVEAFSGSCFMHKERGEDTKLVFGPVWDYGNSFGHSPLTLDCFLYENSPIRRHWITAVAQFPRFQQRVRQLWREKHGDLFDTFADSVAAFTEPLRQAEIQDGLRWERAYINTPLELRRARYMNYINRKVAFLDQQWSQTTCTLAEAIAEKDAACMINDTLHVACLHGGRAYVADNHDHWAAIVLDDLGDSVAQDGIIYGQLQGYMATTSTNPTFLLDVTVDSVMQGRPVVIDTLHLDTPVTLRGNTVVKVEGYCLNHALWKNGDIASNPSCIDLVEDACLINGGYYQLTGVVRQKTAFTSDVEAENFDNYELLVVDFVRHHDMRGDLNGDGKVDITDVNMIIDVLLGNEVSLAEDADINRDGLIDISDFNMLINIIFWGQYYL